MCVALRVYKTYHAHHPFDPPRGRVGVTPTLLMRKASPQKVGARLLLQSPFLGTHHFALKYLSICSLNCGASVFCLSLLQQEGLSYSSLPNPVYTYSAHAGRSHPLLCAPGGLSSSWSPSNPSSYPILDHILWLRRVGKGGKECRWTGNFCNTPDWPCITWCSLDISDIDHSPRAQTSWDQLAWYLWPRSG